jgi:hypothetical protein
LALLYNGVFNTYDYLSSVTTKNVSSTSQKKINIYIYIYIYESERGKREEEGEERCTSLILGFNLIWVIGLDGLDVLFDFYMGMSYQILIVNGKNVTSIKR